MKVPFDQRASGLPDYFFWAGFLFHPIGLIVAASWPIQFVGFFDDRLGLEEHPALRRGSGIQSLTLLRLALWWPMLVVLR